MQENSIASGFQPTDVTSLSDVLTPSAADAPQLATKAPALRPQANCLVSECLGCCSVICTFGCGERCKAVSESASMKERSHI